LTNVQTGIKFYGFDYYISSIEGIISVFYYCKRLGKSRFVVFGVQLVLSRR